MASQQTRTQEGTFFFYFKFNTQIDEREELDHAIKKHGNITKMYDSSESVSPIHNMEGKDTGYVWFTYLTAKEGKEEAAIQKVTEIAYRVAYDVGGLTVDGTKCNVPWYHSNK